MWSEGKMPYGFICCREVTLPCEYFDTTTAFTIPEISKNIFIWFIINDGKFFTRITLDFK